jgi:hypothetical protein
MYHKIKTDAPEIFATLEGCQMIGHLMGRNCVHLIQPDAVYHNMYLALIGESTISRKSTSQRIGREVFPRDLCHPEEASPEQFLVELSEHSNFFAWYGEFTYLMKGINGAGWMARMAEIMNHIFDCPATYTKRLRERDGNRVEFVINDAYLSFNTTCTPEMMEKYVNAETMSGGFLARFLMAEGNPQPRPRGRLSPDVKLFRKRVYRMFLEVQRLSQTTNDEKITFEMTDGALKRYNEIEQELYKRKNILPFVGRYSNYIISIADVLVISDAMAEYMAEPWNVNYPRIKKLDKLNQLDYLDKLDKSNNINRSNFTNLSSIVVSKDYVDKAYDIIKPCFEYVEKLKTYVDVFLPYSKVKKQIDKHGTIDHSTLQRNTHLKPFELEMAIKMLKDEDYIKIEIVEQKGTKNKKIYQKI